MPNLGKAKAYIAVYDKCPNIVDTPAREAFDLSGKALQTALESPANNDGVLQNMESISIRDGWTCAFPSKFEYEIDNYLKTSSSTGGNTIVTEDKKNPRIEWTPNTSNLSQNEFWGKKYSLDQYSDILPQWSDYTRPTTSVKPKTTTTTTTTTTYPASINVPKQTRGEPNCWWGIESTLPLVSTAFYVNINQTRQTPSKEGLLDFILVRLNPVQAKQGDDKCSFDILFNDGKIFLYDWSLEANYDKTATTALSAKAEDGVVGPSCFNTGLTFDENIQIGVMPCLGRIVLFSGNSYYIYQRITYTSPSNDSNSSQDNEKKESFFLMDLKTISAYGSNCKAEVYISPMEFDDGVFHPNIKAAMDPESKRYTKEWAYSTDGKTITVGKKLYIFPGNGGKMVCGVSCDKFCNEDLEQALKDAIKNVCNPYGTIDISYDISLINSLDKTIGITMKPAAILTESKDDFYTNTTDTPTPHVIKSGPPFLTRLRGVAEDTNQVPYTSLSYSSDFNPNPIYDIISISEKFDCQEISLSTHSIDITLYNPDGKYNQFCKKSYGIRAYLTWEIPSATPTPAVISPFFTGVTLDTYTSEIAGKETLSIHCEDYMQILGDQYLQNSPFYDGMDSFDAIEDIAKRGGIGTITDNTDSADDKRYYLPSGYSYAEPAYRFPNTQKLKDCIKDIAQLCERVVYFNENGELQHHYLQGGLAFIGSKIPDIKYYFTRDPKDSTDKTKVYNVILDEKKVEQLVGSTVNEVIVVSVDRMSGQPTITHHIVDILSTWETSSETTQARISGGKRVPYKKFMYMEQSAFGDLASVRKFVSMLIERIYKVPSQISFKTICSDVIPPFTFIAVDNLKYRTTSFQRSYNADDNSIFVTIAAKWLGDEASQKIT